MRQNRLESYRRVVESDGIGCYEFRSKGWFDSPSDQVSVIRLLFASALCVCFLGTPSAWAEVVTTDSLRKEDVLGGKAFGRAGAYEKLSGVIHFAFDPANPRNARIVDLDKAPVDDSGRVLASANFMVLRPKRRCEL
ncbi:MAG: hypothetical protein GY935_25625, partial [Gammaproteobacteria bacterium]|nr:hypothetical protein [Gammaproteobacteria bacterium]